MEINKQEILKKILKKEDKILVSNVLDKYKKFNKTEISTYTNFLDMRQYNLLYNLLDKLKISFNSYRVNEDCEKHIIYFGKYDNFITTYSFKNEGIRHKDVLGTLFSLGYDFDLIGDIFINKDKIYFTNLTRLNGVIDNIYMINNKRIFLEKDQEIILDGDRFINLKLVIPSYRLDVIVSKLANLSRSDACNYIKDKMVLLNYEEVTETSKKVNIGDLISIRKIGKFIISSELSKSKKDNVFIEVKKYN